MVPAQVLLSPSDLEARAAVYFWATMGFYVCCVIMVLHLTNIGRYSGVVAALILVVLFQEC